MIVMTMVMHTEALGHLVAVQLSHKPEVNARRARMALQTDEPMVLPLEKPMATPTTILKTTISNLARLAALARLVPNHNCRA
jgi:hypothetical protein